MNMEAIINNPKPEIVTFKDFNMKYRNPVENSTKKCGNFCQVYIPESNDYVIKGNVQTTFGSAEGVATEAIVRGNEYGQKVTLCTASMNETIGTPFDGSTVIIKVPFEKGSDLVVQLKAMSGKSEADRKGFYRSFAEALWLDIRKLESKGWTIEEISGDESLSTTEGVLGKFPYFVDENGDVYPVDLSSCLRIPTRSEVEKYTYICKFIGAVIEEVERGDKNAVREFQERTLRMAKDGKLNKGTFALIASLLKLHNETYPDIIKDDNQRNSFIEEVWRIANELDQQITDPVIEIGSKKLNIRTIGKHPDFKNDNQRLRDAFAQSRLSNNLTLFGRAMMNRLTFIDNRKREFIKKRDNQVHLILLNTKKALKI